MTSAAIAQLGERQTEDLEVPSSILGHGIISQVASFPDYSPSRKPAEAVQKNYEPVFFAQQLLPASTQNFPAMRMSCH